MEVLTIPEVSMSCCSRAGNHQRISSGQKAGNIDGYKLKFDFGSSWICCFEMNDSRYFIQEAKEEIVLTPGAIFLCRQPRALYFMEA
jgi:hypothetical protein